MRNIILGMIAGGASGFFLGFQLRTPVDPVTHVVDSPDSAIVTLETEPATLLSQEKELSAELLNIGPQQNQDCIDSTSLLSVAELALSGDTDRLIAQIESGEVEGAALELLYLAWADAEPERAMSAALTSGDYTAQHKLVWDMMEGWAARNPYQAEEWLNTCAPDVLGLVESFYTGLCHADLNAALSRYSDFSETVHRESLLRPLVKSMMLNMSSDETWHWLGGLSTDEFEMAMPQVVIMQAKHNPAHAAQIISELPMPVPESSLTTVLGSMMNNDPYGAVEWAESISNDWNRERTLIELYRQWVLYDFSSAVERFVQEDDGSAMWDTIAARMTPAIARERPEDALVWLDGIKDQRLQRKALVASGAIIYQKNPDQLMHWLDGREALFPQDWERIKEP